jgi:F-type H+-transporting ATPase subunit b
MSSSVLSVSLSGAMLSGASIDLDGSLLIQAVVFFLAFFLLRALVFRPLVALFDAREAAIDGAKREAKEIEGDADAKLKAFEGEMKKVKVEAAAERDALRADAARLERELLTKARTEADTTYDSAMQTLRAEGDRIRAEMKPRVPALAKEIADKILGRNAA